MYGEYEKELIRNEYLSKIQALRDRLDECEKNMSMVQQEAEIFSYIGNNIKSIIDEIRLDNRKDEDFIRNLEIYTSELDDAKRIVDKNYAVRYEEFIHEEKELQQYEQNIADEYMDWMNSLEFNNDMDTLD